MHVAVIQDISGLGRCSLAAALPVLGVLGVQACPVPTAVYTNQTGYASYETLDCAQLMAAFPTQWARHGAALDGVQTGFFGNQAQIRAAQALIDQFRRPGTLLLIDPVMGDDGRRYPCFDEYFCCALRRFAMQADVLTPNVTELCLLTGTDFAVLQSGSEAEQLTALQNMCAALPVNMIVATGWRWGDEIRNVVSDHGKISIYASKALGGSYSGTGDLFAAALCGYLLRGVPVGQAVPRIMAFLEACLRDAIRLGIPANDGVPFELHLDLLMKGDFI